MIYRTVRTLTINKLHLVNSVIRPPTTIKLNFIQFKEGYSKFTTLRIEPLNNNRGRRTRCIYLLNAQYRAQILKCTLAYRVNSQQMTSYLGLENLNNLNTRLSKI